MTCDFINSTVVRDDSTTRHAELIRAAESNELASRHPREHVHKNVNFVFQADSSTKTLRLKEHKGFANLRDLALK